MTKPASRSAWRTWKRLRWRSWPLKHGGEMTKGESMFPQKIISGGQTGVDRAALDVALELGIPIGGHLPKGRKDENGDVLPEDKYANMQETDTDDVNVRTELNVQNSDATLIFSHGALFGGSEYTERMARKHGKPCLHVDFDKQDADQAVLLVRAWLLQTRSLGC